MLVIDPQWVASAVLLWLRLGALLLLTPLMTSFKGPVSFRVLFTGALAALMAAGLSGAARAPVDTLPAFVLGALSEVLLGAVLAFGLHVAFAALQAAAQLIDLQMGLGIGGVFDPATRKPSSALGMALQWLAIIVFFSIEGHHALLRGVAFSVERVPLGLPFMAYPPAEVIAMFGAVFTLALLIGAPVIAALLVLELGLAVVSKALPQMNIFFVSIPVKLLVGLGMLVLLSRQLAALLARSYAGVFDYWAKVLS